MIPSLDDFVGGDREKLLMCAIRALKKYLSQMEQCNPASPTSSFRCLIVRNGCPETPLHFGLNWSLAMHMHMFLRRTADCLESGLMKFGRLPRHCHLGRAAIHQVL